MEGGGGGGGGGGSEDRIGCTRGQNMLRRGGKEEKGRREDGDI